MQNTRTRTRNMTEGSITKQILLFSVPLMFGNIFQMLYNTVDSIVVGNYVGKEALAAVGATSMIVNMLVFFFNGFSIGAGVVISRFFGAKNARRLHDAIETTITTTFLFCILFTAIGYYGVDPMLRFMKTPEDVFGQAQIYLQIYFLGFSGLLVYNMGSAILRAVGDTARPLLFLMFTSIMNIILDILFVKVFRFGISGAAYATIISQFISAIMVMILLTTSKEIYRFVWKDVKLDKDILKSIFIVGLPAGIQSVITAFSNVFVQSYVNHFGSSCMAGWSSYNKLDTFIMLPMSSMAMAATTFVSQNIGAGDQERADRGTSTTLVLSVSVTASIAALLYTFAAPATGLFTKDASVIEAGVLFLRTNVFFLMCNTINHVLAGALRGRGDARGPMIIMLTNFVLVRQAYLFLVTRFVANIPILVGLGYPVGWSACCITEVTYWLIRRRSWNRKNTEAAL